MLSEFLTTSLPQIEEITIDSPMEAEIETLLKEKKQQVSILASIPTVAPSTIGTSTTWTSTSMTIIVETWSTHSVEQLSKDMGDLSLKYQEIGKLMMQLQKILKQKIKYDNAYLAKIQKNDKLTQQSEVYENESLISQPISQAKKNI